MIRPHVLRRFAERFGPNGFSPSAYVASYGMAEATLALSFAPLDQGLKTEVVDLDRLESESVATEPDGATTREREFTLCGPALPDHEIECRAPDGAALPERRVGRVFARGPSLLRDYFREPAATAETITPDGWLDTGDLGYLTGGELVITGRAKDLILVNGRNVWPQDLEWTVEAEIPAMRSGDVAVFSVDRPEGEEVVALVQCRLREPEARDALTEEIGKLLRLKFGTPVTVRLVGAHALPTTSSGKLSRARAREMYLAMLAEAALTRARLHRRIITDRYEGATPRQACTASRRSERRTFRASHENTIGAEIFQTRDGFDARTTEAPPFPHGPIDRPTIQARTAQMTEPFGHPSSKHYECLQFPPNSRERERVVGQIHVRAEGSWRPRRHLRHTPLGLKHTRLSGPSPTRGF